MKRSVVFLRGTYPIKYLSFYRGLCRGSLKVAADGGYSFFRKTGLVPDVLIGDMDSIKCLPANLSPKTRMVRFPQQKDKTDGQLALEFCLDEGYRTIDLVSPTVGEIDHHLGNIMLLHRAASCLKSVSGSVRLVNHRYEIRLVIDGSVSFTRAVGDTISVIPQSQRIVLSSSGMEYSVKDCRVGLGDSRGLRNRVCAARASVSVKGWALVVRRYTI